MFLRVSLQLQRKSTIFYCEENVHWKRDSRGPELQKLFPITYNFKEHVKIVKKYVVNFNANSGNIFSQHLMKIKISNNKILCCVSSSR